MLKLFKEEQPQNAPPFIFLSPEGRVTSVRDSQKEKASPISVTLSGIEILSRDSHQLKVLSLIQVIPSGITIFFRE